MIEITDKLTDPSPSEGIGLVPEDNCYIVSSLFCVGGKQDPLDIGKEKKKKKKKNKTEVQSISGFLSLLETK